MEPNDASNVIKSSTSKISLTNNSSRTRRAAADQNVDLCNDTGIIAAKTDIIETKPLWELWGNVISHNSCNFNSSHPLGRWRFTLQLNFAC